MPKNRLKTNQLFLRKNRLVKPAQYKYLFNKPKRSSDNYFIILAKKNNIGYPRLGLAISKKNINLSVQRNRVKRLIREYFRKEITANYQLNQFPLDFVVMAKKNINLKSNVILVQSLAYNFQKLQILT